MKVCIFEVDPWERGFLEALAQEHDIEFFSEVLDAETVKQAADAEIVSTFIYSRLNRSLLEKLPGLQLIATRSTGVRHIDIDYCRERGIEVANVAGYGNVPVAEHVFGLLLTISHNLTAAIERTRRGDFSLQGLRGFDLKGKTLGVIGTGYIGRNVIRIAKGFGMDAVAFDVKPNKEAAEELGFRYADMDELLTEADVITLHVPGTEKTKNLLSRDEFSQMKEGVVLINTARGSVVDVQALMQALADGKVAAAGLDVLPEEPVIREEAELLRAAFRKEHPMDTLLADHILLRLRNVYITPHSAFDTVEARQTILETTVDNIRSFAKGQARNLVTSGAAT
jgi:D-lactate dehydrogenase